MKNARLYADKAMAVAGNNYYTGFSITVLHKSLHGKLLKDVKKLANLAVAYRGHHTRELLQHLIGELVVTKHFEVAKEVATRFELSFQPFSSGFAIPPSGKGKLVRLRARVSACRVLLNERQRLLEFLNRLGTVVVAQADKLDPLQGIYGGRPIASARRTCTGQRCGTGGIAAQRRSRHTLWKHRMGRIDRQKTRLGSNTSQTGASNSSLPGFLCHKKHKKTQKHDRSFSSWLFVLFVAILLGLADAQIRTG